GIFLKRGERFVPRIGWLLWLCGAWLIATIVWKHVPGVGPAANRFMAELGRAGVPFYVVSFDKTFVAVLRLSHFLALAYVLSCFSWVYAASESRWVEPLRLLGQNGLAVFATGSVLSVLLQAINAGIERSLLSDLVLIGAGLGVQFALAYGLRVTKRAQASKKAMAAKAAP